MGQQSYCQAMPEQQYFIKRWAHIRFAHPTIQSVVHPPAPCGRGLGGGVKQQIFY